MDRREAARAYYRALDDGDYGALADLLAPGFVHDRPDRTLRGRDRFVQFVREERPRTDTIHAVDAVYESVPEADATGTDVGGAPGGADASGPDSDVAVRGRLLAGDDVLVRFVDAFRFEGDVVVHLWTYTN